MDLDAWKTLNRLIERALDLSLDDRTTWLEDLGPEYEAFKPRLREMLARLESGEDSAALGTLPKWDPLLTGERDPAGAAAEGLQVGPYTLTRQLATGGQGTVWLAERRDGLVDRPVAIKLPAGLGMRRGLAERLARERDILARLTHPHIARLYDAGLSDVGPFLALEYVEGVAIHRHVAEHGLDVTATLKLALQVMDALAYAHGQLVIHRDIKPSNVLVTPEGQVRLLDFGIAKLLDESPDRDSTMTMDVGRALTLAYASPEQIERQTLGVATDVYSLGVLLYELLCGRRPHVPARDTPAALEDAILHADPPRPSDVARDPVRGRRLRGDLDAILLQALRRRPEDRYATVAAFANDIRAFLGGLPVAAQPDSRAYRVRKFVARHRLAMTAAAAVVTALATGAGVALWQAREARLERDRADTVKAFIVSMFRDVDPNLQGAGRPLTAVDVLSLAYDRLEALPADDPAVRAELLRVLGESFLSVGDPRRAADVLGAALPALAQVSGRASDEALGAELRLALAEQMTGKGDASTARLNAVHQALEQSGRLDREIFVDLAVMRVETLVNQGLSIKPGSLDSAQQAVDAATRILGPAHPKRARALQLLATVERTNDRHLLALGHAEEAYRLLTTLHPGNPRHAGVVLAQNDYGRSLMQVGRVRDAVTQLEQAAANGLDTFRNNPVVQQHLLGTLVNVQLSYGAVKDAVANLEKASAIDLEGVQLSPTYIAGQHIVRARALVAASRPGDALAFYDQAVALFAKTGNTSMGPQIASERVEALVQLGRFAEAERDLAPFMANTTAPLPPLARRARWLLGEMARQRGQRDRALALLREAVDFTANTGRNRLMRASMQVSLGLTLLDARALDEAASTLEEARAVFAAEQGLMTPAHAAAIAALARVRLAAGRPGDALPLLGQAVAFWRDFAPAHEEGARLAALIREVQGRPAVVAP